MSVPRQSLLSLSLVHMSSGSKGVTIVERFDIVS